MEQYKKHVVVSPEIEKEFAKASPSVKKSVISILEKNIRESEKALKHHAILEEIKQRQALKEG